ncbi:hypothetical protein IFM89_023046 [Coptis chinensis]|uniref:Transposase n=1 Tax=Coptis chinensis TaxID=261450 RepID=A0A835IAN6_9MAGN|nr:hypothetical protein IFM89_023046 [Coptis chinensis]
MPQSSPSGSHQPNVSQPSESAGENTLRSSNGKLPIIVHANGRVTRVYSAKWSSRVGYWIRVVVPISYAIWDKVDDSFKDEVWLKLMEQFQLNVNPTMGVRKNIKKWFAPKFRYWKYALGGKILKNCEFEQEAISSCPTRKPYGRILEELDEANPEKKHRCTDSWKYGHKHRDGTVFGACPRILCEFVKKIVLIKSCSPYSSICPKNFRTELQVLKNRWLKKQVNMGVKRFTTSHVIHWLKFFGKDKGSRTRGLSSCMSNKQLQTFAIAEELVELEISSKSKLEDELAEVKSTVENLLAGQTRMETMMAGILDHVRLNGSANGQPSTPTTEVDYTSVPVPRTQQVPNLINQNGSLNPPSRLTSYLNVKILGRKGEHVANGYVKTDNQKCHFRDIMGDEKVVYITNVLVGDAPVYDGPQDDILYL